MCNKKILITQDLIIDLVDPIGSDNNTLPETFRGMSFSEKTQNSDKLRSKTISTKRCYRF